MNWTILLIIAMAIAVIFVPRLIGWISTEDAQAYLKCGALVIDVRSRGEFDSDHLPNAINYPLDEIGRELPRRVKDKNQVLLMHCHSGLRSGLAKKRLRALAGVSYETREKTRNALYLK